MVLIIHSVVSEAQCDRGLRCQRAECKSFDPDRRAPEICHSLPNPALDLQHVELFSDCLSLGIRRRRRPPSDRL
jgi:hypothetical protein